MTHAGGHSAVAFTALILMWWAMMAVMMLPVTVPWFRALARIADGRRPLVGFGAGYVLVWLGFSVSAAALQLWLASLGLLDGNGALTAVAGGLLLIGAGLYQLTPAKTACLKHCRTPMSFFLARWDNGPVGTLRLGLGHGLFCLGCCWALMSLGFAFGVMSVAWMGALTGVVALENLGRKGLRLSIWVGIGLIGLGVTSVVLGGIGA